MINKDVLIKYVRIISGCDADPNLTLVDFSLNDEQRNVVNLVNDEAKKDKDLANLLDDLKYSNNKTKLIEEYFDKKVGVNSSDKSKHYVPNSRIDGKNIIDNSGFINMTSIVSMIGMVTIIITMVVAFGSK